MENSRKISILIVDDDPLMRKALRYYLQREDDFEVCAEADDSATAISAVAKWEPDCVLVDILGFPEPEGGLQIIKRIKARHKDLPVLAVSSYDASIYAAEALKAGANGYLMKEEAGQKLAEVIQKILVGETYVSGEVGMTC
jgi:DNA-binding NarL/FixJ family response regulator